MGVGVGVKTKTWRGGVTKMHIKANENPPVLLLWWWCGDVLLLLDFVVASLQPQA